MSERGEGNLDKYLTWDRKPNFSESFTAKALLLDLEDAPMEKQNELWAKATDADLETYANQRAEYMAGDYAELLKTAEGRRAAAWKALGMENKSTFERAMDELADDKKNFDDLERTMGTGDPK